jgi:hypothetical protein
MSRRQRTATTHPPTGPHRLRCQTTPSGLPLSAGRPEPPGRVESSDLPRTPFPKFVGIFYPAVKATRKRSLEIFFRFLALLGVFWEDSPGRPPCVLGSRDGTAELCRESRTVE